MGAATDQWSNKLLGLQKKRGIGRNGDGVRGERANAKDLNLRI